MIRPRSTRTDTLFPATTLSRFQRDLELTLQINPVIFVYLLPVLFQAIADEHGLRLDALLRLAAEGGDRDVIAIGEAPAADGHCGGGVLVELGDGQRHGLIPAILHGLPQAQRLEIGRASCRERVCQYV